MKTRFTVLNTKDYFQLLNQKIDKVKKQALFISLYFDYGKNTQKVYHFLKNRKRGQEQVIKKLILDDFSLSPVIKQESRRAIRKLKEQGVVLIKNKMSLWQKLFFPYFCRNHIKITILDNLGCFGGINLSDKESSYQDLMICSKDKHFVSILKYILLRSIQKSLKYHLITFNQQNKFIIDDSQKQLSYACAKIMIRKAKKNIYFVSQFPPDYFLARLMTKASKRGVKVILVIPGYNQFSFVFNLIYLLHLITTKPWQKYFKITKTQKMTHAKILLIDNKLVLVGSSNLTAISTWAKTKELMLLSQDQELIKQIKSFVKNLG